MESMCSHFLRNIVFVLEKAEELKNAGNEAYTKKDFATAISFYTEGIKIQCADKELVSKLYNNRSTVYFYLGNILNVGSITKILTEGRGVYGYPYRLPLIFSLESALIICKPFFFVFMTQKEDMVPGVQAETVETGNKNRCVTEATHVLEKSLGKVKFRAFPKRVGQRILSLESVDYFGTSEHF